jgi:hypothetical protein
LAGALLEHLDFKRVPGIFATHLHEILQLPLLLERVRFMRMGIEHSAEGMPRWTYELLNGSCTDSLALVTARQYGIPDQILKRAAELEEKFDTVCRASSKTHPDIVARRDDAGDVREEYKGNENCGSEDDNISGSVGNVYGDTSIKPSETAVKSRRKKSTSLTAIESSALTTPVDVSDGIPSESPLQSSIPIPLGADIERSLDEVSVLLRRVGGVRKVHLVECDHDPPPSLEGLSVVYVLRLCREGLPDTFYVGETESIRLRIAQHRYAYIQVCR